MATLADVTTKDNPRLEYLQDWVPLLDDDGNETGEKAPVTMIAYTFFHDGQEYGKAGQLTGHHEPGTPPFDMAARSLRKEIAKWRPSPA
jgi:hypothetical protein